MTKDTAFSSLDRLDQGCGDGILSSDEIVPAASQKSITGLTQTSF